DGIRDFHVTGVQTCALPIFSFYDAAVSGDTLYSDTRTGEEQIFNLLSLHLFPIAIVYTLDGTPDLGELADRSLRCRWIKLINELPNHCLNRIALRNASPR